MNRRILRLGLVVGCAGAILTGCETPHPLGLRMRDDSQAARLVAPSESQEFGTDVEAGSRGFFKPSRLRGALSSEGAEVEHHLGIP